MAEDQQVGPGLYVKFGADFASLVGAGGAAAIVLNQTLDLFQKFEHYGQMAFDNTVGKAIAYQEAIEDLHNTLGMTNADAQKWKSTLVSFDTDMGSFSSTLRYLTQRVADNSTAGENLRATLKGIGVDAKDASGNYKDASQMMQEILVKLDGMPEGARKANLELEIFGRNWSSIANLVNNGTLAVQKFKEQQPLFSDEELDRIDKAKTKMGEFNQKIDAIGAKTGSALLENYGIKSLLDYLSGSGEYAENEAKWNAFMDAKSGGFPGDFNTWALAQKAFKSTVPGSGGATASDRGLLTGPETLQQKLDEITNTTLPKLKQAYLDAIPTGNMEQINSARKAYNDVLNQQFDITNQIRDQNLQYRSIIDVTLPKLKEALDKAKATGIKTEIEAADIALKQGVNSANDLGTALGKAAISADSIKASITPASGWSYKSVVGSAGSEMQTFMLDEMNHGASYEVALAAYNAGVHSYSAFAGKYPEGSLGAVVNSNKSSTRNPGKNEREEMASAAKGGASATVGEQGISPGSPAETAALQTELGKQKDAFTDLNTHITKSWSELEKIALIHYTAMSDLARLEMQKEMDDWYTAAKYITETIALQQTITVTDGAMEADPIKFTAAAPPTLNAIDFSSIKFSEAASGGSSDTGNNSSGKSGGTTVQVKVENSAEVTSKVTTQVGQQQAVNATARGY